MPAALQVAGHRTQTKFLEIFTAHIRNPMTRRSYAKAAMEFLRWCEVRGARSLDAITPIHVAGWIVEIADTLSTPTVKQRLAADRRSDDVSLDEIERILI